MNIEKIIKKCIRRDQKALRILYDMISIKLMSIARRYSKNDYEANDIFQEAFIKIINNLHQFDIKKGIFEAWAYRITVNEALAFIKTDKKHLSNNFNEVEDVFIDETTLPNDVEYQELQNLIDQLPLKQKVVFNLYVIDGYSHQEIADQLSITESTSRTNLKKARTNLQKLHQETFSIKIGR